MEVLTVLFQLWAVVKWQGDVLNERSIYLYSACVLLYTQSTSQSYEGGGGLLNHHQCAASNKIIANIATAAGPLLAK